MKWNDASVDSLHKSTLVTVLSPSAFVGKSFQRTNCWCMSTSCWALPSESRLQSTSRLVVRTRLAYHCREFPTKYDVTHSLFGCPFIVTDHRICVLTARWQCDLTIVRKPDQTFTVVIKDWIMLYAHSICHRYLFICTQTCLCLDWTELNWLNISRGNMNFQWGFLYSSVF